MPSLFWAERRLARVALAAALAAAIAQSGCGGDASGLSEGAVLRVYVSLPLSGVSGADGQDAADAARLALADAGEEAGGVPVQAVYLDDTEGAGAAARWTPAQAAANARAATQDSTAIAYLGDFESGATRASLPLTNEARLLHVSPASAAVDLVAPGPGSDDVPQIQSTGERNFGRVIPADDAQAAAAAAWAERRGVRRAGTLSDGTRFGDTMVAAFTAALERAVVSRRGIRFLYYGGHADREPASLTQSMPQVMVSDAELPPSSTIPQPPGALATSAALDPSQLPTAGRDFARRFREEYDRRPGRYAAYGYEAMAVILDSIDRATDPGDRPSVVAAFFATAERDSVLGTYSIDEVGDTTLGRMTGYALRGQTPVPVAELGGGAKR